MIQEVIFHHTKMSEMAAFIFSAKEFLPTVALKVALKASMESTGSQQSFSPMCAYV